MGEIIHAEDEVLKMVRDAVFERHKPTDYHVVDFLYGIFKKKRKCPAFSDIWNKNEAGT